LAAMCDLRTGCENSRFGVNVAKLSLIPGDGGAYFLTQAIGYSRAMEMLLTGEIYDSDWALNAGLLNHVFSQDKLHEETEALALKIAENGPLAIAMIKRSMKDMLNFDLNGYLDVIAAMQGIAQNSKDHDEGLRAAKAKEIPHFTGE